MGFDDSVVRDAGGALEAVDVLGETLEEEAFVGDEADKGVGEGGVVFARVEFVREGVEGERVGAEEVEFEDGFRVRQVEPGEVRV